MEELTLSSRKKLILQAIIDAHVKDGEPVGSKYLAQSQLISCSSATIRNEMAELEQMGLLEQPHTSAGRIPTELGYRYYVNSLLENYSAVASEVQDMSTSLRRKLGELDGILAEASRMAAALTNYPGIAMKAKPAQVSVVRFDGVFVDEHKFLLVMMFASGMVRTKTVETEESLAKEDLELVLSVLNDLLPGKSADTINLPLMVELEARVGRLSPMVGQIVKLVYDTMLEQSGSDLRVEGVNRLLQYHEYEDIDELRKMMTLFEEKQDLLSAISDGARESSDDGVQVFIGSENSVKVMNNSTLIYRPVKRGDRVIGAIGVVGPRRMDYAKVISIIDHLTRGIDSLLSGEQTALDAPKNDNDT